MVCKPNIANFILQVKMRSVAMTRHYYITYLASVTKQEWEKLQPSGLLCMKNYYNYMVNDHLLRAVSQLWCPVNHVFRTRRLEICPTLEDFSGIMNLPCAKWVQPALPAPKPDANHFSLKWFKLPLPSLRRMISRDKEQPGLKLSVAFDILQDLEKDDPSWIPLMILLLMGCFLCTSTVDVVDFRLVSLLPNISRDKPPVMIILAETIRGLDMHKKGRIEGSPILLNIWVTERFKLIPSPKDPKKYNPGNFWERGRSLELGTTKTTAEWKDWINNTEAKDILWICPWWKTYATTQQFGNKGVLLLGLREAVRYFPERICRQYGLRQRIPHVVVDLENIYRYKSKFISKFEKDWRFTRKFHIMNTIPRPGDFETSTVYDQWLPDYAIQARMGQDGMVQVTQHYQNFE